MRRGDVSRRGRPSDGFEPIIPVGAGLVVRRLRVDERDTVKLGLALSGYDGLASVHGETRGVVCVVTTSSRAGELDAVLEALAQEITLARLA